LGSVSAQCYAGGVNEHLDKSREDFAGQVLFAMAVLHQNGQLDSFMRYLPLRSCY